MTHLKKQAACFLAPLGGSGQLERNHVKLEPDGARQQNVSLGCDAAFDLAWPDPVAAEHNTFFYQESWQACLRA